MTTWKTIALTLLLAAATAANLAAQSLELVSRVHSSQTSDTGTGARPLRYEQFFGNGIPPSSSLSADGRYAVFLSAANNLVPGQKDLNAFEDVFLRDLVAGTTVLVSHAMSSPATAGNARSSEAVISADGRYVAFTSRATDLVPGQRGDFRGLDTDILLYDRVTGTTTLVAETEEDFSFFADLAINADGRYIAFTSDASDLLPGNQRVSNNVFLYDRIAGTIRLVSHTSASATATAESGHSDNPAISADGRFVAFSSSSPDLLPGQPSTQHNVFLFDRVSGNLVLAGSGQAFAMSADGRYVSVLSFGGMLLLYDQTARETTPLTDSSGAALQGGVPVMSADGRYIAFVRSQALPSSSFLETTLVLYDRVSRALTRITQPSTTQTTQDEVGSRAISANGRYIVFTSTDRDLVPGQTDVFGPDVFLFDRSSGKITLVSHAGGSSATTGEAPSYKPAISANGSRVVFWSAASDLAAGVNDRNESYDLFAHHVASGSTNAVTLRAPDLPSLSPNGRSEARALSADGRYVAFQSDSSHLIAGQEDANDSTDIFLYDRTARSTILVTRSNGSSVRTANGRSTTPVLSADGRYVAFLSAATDLETGTVDPNTSCDVFLFDRVAGSTTFVGKTHLGCETPGASPPSAELRISPDGRWVAFTSQAGDLVPGQQEPEDLATLDVFLWDRVTRSTVLVSRSNAGAAVAGNAESFAPEISADGRYVAFASGASDLVAGQIDSNHRSLDLFLFDRVTRSTVLVSHLPSSAVTAATVDGNHCSMSADAQFIAFASEENLDPSVTGSEDGVYLYDRTHGTNHWIAPYGFFAQPELSADGRFLAFFSSVELIPGFSPGSRPQLYVHDRLAKTLTLITKPSVPNGRASFGYSGNAVISADGRFIAFNSDAVDLVPGQVSAPGRDYEDVLLFDRTSGVITLVSRLQTSPLTAVGRSGPPLLSASGRQVAFTSEVNLGDGDMNNLADAYLFQVSSPVALPPCKLLDTRRRADRPALRSDTRRTIRATGVCGVPATAKSVSVTVTALQATGKGNLRFYAGNDTVNSSGILRFEKNATRSATFNLPLATNGAGTLAILPFVAGKGTVQVVVEVNGYSQ